MKTDLLDYTDESFKVGEHDYHLYDDSSTQFVLSKNTFPLVVIVKITSMVSGKEQTIFESYEPLSHFKNAEDRAAIKLAINFLKEKYQS